MQHRSQVPAKSKGAAHAAGGPSALRRPARRRPALLRVLLRGRRRRSAAEWVTQQELDAELGYGRD